MSRRRPARRRKDRRKSAPKTAVAKRVPKHGHGLLNVGGVWGNKGGTGRPPAYLRSRAREVLEVGLREMNQRLKPKQPKVADGDLARMVTALGRIGLGDRPASGMTAEQFVEAVARLAEVVNRFLGPKQRGEFVKELERVAIPGTARTVETSDTEAEG